MTDVSSWIAEVPVIHLTPSFHSQFVIPEDLGKDNQREQEEQAGQEDLTQSQEAVCVYKHI